MSKTIRKEKSSGYDFWSRRSFGFYCLGYGKIAKWITKKIERRRNREMINRAMKDPEDFEKRFPGE